MIVVLSGHFLYYLGWQYSKWIANCLDQLQFGLLYIFFTDLHCSRQAIIRNIYP